MQFNFSSIFGGIALLSVLGIVIFILKRIRRQRKWMPILKIIELPKKQLPKLKIVSPPWVAFICFLITAIAMLIFSLRPQLTVAVQQKTSQVNTHLFVDLSPSVSAYTNYDQFMDKIANVFTLLKQSGDVTVSTNLEKNILQFEASSKLLEYFGNQTFGKQGFQLGKRVTEDLAQLEKIDRLVIASDGAPTTWKNLNWSYFQEDMQVFWLPASDDLSLRKNLYFEKIEPLAGSTSNSSGYEVVIRRNYTGSVFRAKVSAYDNDMLVNSQSIEFQPNSQRISLQMFLKPKPSPPRVEEEKTNQLPPHLRWTIETDADTLKLDNQFRTYKNSMGRNVLLISSTEGESMLEEPAHQLSVSLKTIGYRVRRMDHLEKLNSVPKESLIISLLGSGIKPDSQCPSYDQPSFRKKKIWLAPNSIDADFSNLCHCFESMVKRKKTSNTISSVCQDAYDRERFIATAQALGAFQIGGQIGRANQSLALNWKDVKNENDVYLFTTPLTPRPLTGLNYGTFPIFIRNFLQWMNKGKQQGIWPRTMQSDLSKDGISTKLFNVPILESQLNLVQKATLPPILNLNIAKGPISKADAIQKKEPLPVLKVLALFVFAMMGFELAYGLFFSQRYQTNLAILFGVLFLASLDAKSYANNKIAFVSSELPANLTYKKLALEVSSRTSLNVSEKTKNL